MTYYYTRTPQDVERAIDESDLDLWDWPANTSVEDFAAFLLVNSSHRPLDVYTLVYKVKEYLETAKDPKAIASVRSTAQGYADHLNGFNAKLGELGNTMVNIRRRFGLELMFRLARLATASDRDLRVYLEAVPEGIDLSSPIVIALEMLATAVEPFEHFDPAIYTPGACELTDHVVVAEILDMDETLPLAKPYDGREEYMAPAVAALVNLGKNSSAHSIAREIAVSRIADKRPTPQVTGLVRGNPGRAARASV